MPVAVRYFKPCRASKEKRMRLRRLNRMVVTGILLFVFLGPLAAELAAQTAELPRRTETVAWTSGSHDGPLGGEKDPPEMALLDTIQVYGAPWIQLQFSGGHLGKNSFVELTSVADDAIQHLDSDQLAQWDNRSAYFNGDAVEIRLYVGAGDQGVSIDVPEAVVGEWGLPAKSICGSFDNRVASSEPRTGRIDPVGCTGFVIAGGQQLTAGHCLAKGPRNRTLSFNVPPSLPDGTVQFPPPQDQYSINLSSFEFVSGGPGNDWGTFAVSDNSQTGLQPIAAQGSFSVVQDLGPANIRITGFGTVTGTTTNQTNQTHVGPNDGSSGTTLRYRTDTEGGNSGSPVIDEATGSAVGIHGQGGCSTSGGHNRGTSFFNSALWNAIDMSGGNSSFTAVADSWVWQNNPTANHGSWTALYVRSAGTGRGRHTYLKFHVSGVSGAVQSATLRIHTGGVTGGVGFPASRVYWMVDTTWNENTITWNNAPLDFHLQYPTYDLPANSWVELDVSPIVSGNGTYTIGLVGPDEPGLWYHSRESQYKPTLIVDH